ncbi:Stealth protein CR1, conserved region 1 [Shewanella morhuae]|uniref:Stealth CR1 domain-containing protein n=1 Tax=Shewanella morhuae TaxID=365591 RepID=UPI0009569E3F|nr:Stealth CR1 domain-containing protein [Shewanella morhuae]SIQ50891.1 Stealth protein CR1, conserved region 1 [Shewanella morhuae]
MDSDKNDNVDIIIYWVDGSDPEWLNQYSKYKAMPPKRFRDLSTLKYVFRGFDKFFPWVRHIHFITSGHLPSWLNLSNPRLKFHTHENIFIYPDALPVFNSSAIEINFANIDGLAEKFILFNDDMLVLNPVDIERFFINNLPVDYLKLSYPRQGFIYSKLKPQNYLAAQFIMNAYKYIGPLRVLELDIKNIFSKNYSMITNVNNLLYFLLLKVMWLDIYHQPQPHLKSTWLKFIGDNKDGVIKNTVYSKFRSPNDINQYLFRFINLLSGRFYPKQFRDHLSIYVKNELDIDKVFQLRKLPTFLCICEEESIDDHKFEKLKIALSNNLLRIFPEKSSFEK